MKKNILTKILLAILVVLLAFSVVACKKKEVIDEKKNGGDEEVNENLAKMEDIGKILDGLQPLAQQFELIDKQLHADLALVVQFNQTQFLIKVQGNIYADAPEDNEVLLEIIDASASPAKTVLGVYLKDNVFYLNQEFTASTPLSKFSNLDGFELSEKLSELPGFIKEQDLKLTKLLGDLKETILSLSFMADSIIETTGFLEFFNDADAFRLAIVSEKLGAAIPELLDTFGLTDFGDLQGLVDFVSNIIFGTTLDKIATADPADFPSLSIKALKSGTAVKGIEIYYEGELDDSNTQKDVIRVTLNADLHSSTKKTVAFPSFGQYVEGALKATVSLELGQKGLRLAGDIFADPNFKDDGTNKPTAYLSNLKVYSDAFEDGIAINAEYNGETLIFDLEPLYDLLGADKPENMVYGIDFDFFEAAEEVIDDTTEAAEGIDLPFEISSNWISVLVGKLPQIIDLVKDTADKGALDINTDFILNTLLDGLLVKKGTTTKYDKTAMIADLESALATLALDYDKEAADDYTPAQITALATAAIAEITGIEGLTVTQLINATGNDSVQIYLGLIEDALGFELDLKSGTKGFLNISIELDIVNRTDVVNGYPSPSNFADFEAGVDYIDLNAEFDAENPDALYNIYIVIEGEGEEAKEVKKYIIIDELFLLLEAYRAYGQK